MTKMEERIRTQLAILDFDLNFRIAKDSEEYCEIKNRYDKLAAELERLQQDATEVERCKIEYNYCSICGTFMFDEEIAGYTDEQRYIFKVHAICKDCQEENDIQHVEDIYDVNYSNAGLTKPEIWAEQARVQVATKIDETLAGEAYYLANACYTKCYDKDEYHFEFDVAGKVYVLTISRYKEKVWFTISMGRANDLGADICRGFVDDPNTAIAEFVACLPKEVE